MVLGTFPVLISAMLATFSQTRSKFEPIRIFSYIRASAPSIETQIQSTPALRICCNFSFFNSRPFDKNPVSHPAALASAIHSGNLGCNKGSPPPVKSMDFISDKCGLMAFQTSGGISPRFSAFFVISLHGHITHLRLQAIADSTCSRRHRLLGGSFPGIARSLRAASRRSRYRGNKDISSLKVISI